MQMTALVFVFLLLRFYTRVFVVRSVGMDDVMYLVSWVSVEFPRRYEFSPEYGSRRETGRRIR